MIISEKFYVLIIVFFLISCNKENTIENLEIGDKYQGGTIIYFFKEGDIEYIPGEVHGIVASEGLKNTAGEYIKAHWGCMNTEIDGADNEKIGSGYKNTIDIINACSEPNIAAKLCYDYSIEVDGIIYDDWFLPSAKELVIIYAIYESVWIGHWSSTEYDKWTAISFWKDVDMGIQEDISDKTSHKRVIAVHTF